MVTPTKFEQFVEDLAHGVHNLGSDQLVVALTNAANAPSTSLDAVLADIVQIAYTNLSTRNITTSSSGQTAGTYSLVLTDLTLTASGGAAAAFQYVVIYNDTPATAPIDPLICFINRGSELTLNDGESLLIDFNASGLFTLT